MRYVSLLPSLWRIEKQVRQLEQEVTHKVAWPPHGWVRNMPLVKSSSKAAFRQNVKAEVKAGKPVKQAVAIAYSVKKNAKTNQR
jgi:hypothetical protein